MLRSLSEAQLDSLVLVPILPHVPFERKLLAFDFNAGRILLVSHFGVRVDTIFIVGFLQSSLEGLGLCLWILMVGC